MDDDKKGWRRSKWQRHTDTHHKDNRQSTKCGESQKPNRQLVPRGSTISRGRGGKPNETNQRQSSRSHTHHHPKLALSNENILYDEKVWRRDMWQRKKNCWSRNYGESEESKGSTNRRGRGDKPNETNKRQSWRTHRHPPKSTLSKEIEDIHYNFMDLKFLIEVLHQDERDDENHWTSHTQGKQHNRQLRNSGKSRKSKRQFGLRGSAKIREISVQPNKTNQRQSSHKPHSNDPKPAFSKNENICYDFMDSKFLTKMLQQQQSLKSLSDYLIGGMPTFLKVVSKLPEEILMLMIRITAKACGNRAGTSKSVILKSFLQDKLVSVLCTFLSNLLTKDFNDKTHWNNIKEVLGCILTILEENMQLLPMSSWEYVQTVTKNLSMVMPALQNTQNMCDNLNPRILSLQTDLEKMKNKFNRERKEAAVNSSDSGEAPGDDFRHLDAFPRANDLTIPNRPPIKSNILKGKFASVKDYLGIHFRLLREDFVNPIREDVCDFLNESDKRLFNIKVHGNAKFLHKEIVKGIICYKIKFDIYEGLKNMLSTGESKRFIQGTLLLFSRDIDFKSLICARVCGNDNLKDGYLYVCSDDTIHFDTSYTMIECVLFFEPYYQLLRCLQLLPHDSLPMDRYLVNVNTNVSPPKYLANIGSYKLSDGLNPSQKTALHAAMNKEFVIIQGPPGTGKTFLGMELVKMLLTCKPRWTHRGPILVMTRTNHALDQFLAGLADFSNKIIRFGRNSSGMQSLGEACRPERQKNILDGFHATNFNFYESVDDDDIIRQIGVHFNPDGSIRRPSYPVIAVNRKKFGRKKGGRWPLYITEKIQINLNEIPIHLRRWLINKIMLRNLSEEITEYERLSLQLKNSISLVNENGENAVISPQKLCMDIPNEISDIIIPYYFDNFEFYLWLFYDDGSIVINEQSGPTDKASNVSEEEDVFYFLSNFVFVSKHQSLKQSHILYLSELMLIPRDMEQMIQNENNPGNLQALTNQLHYIRQKLQYIEFCLKTDFGRPKVNLSRSINPFSLPSMTRWQLYKYWVDRCKIALRQKLDKDLEGCSDLLQIHTVLKNSITAQLFNSMDIIAMTASDAASNRQILELMESPILIVEEAAEVLESHIITALTEHCQHLILLGDHQQLRPSTSDHVIQRKYKLGVSLFERMIENGIEYHTLNVQHRMRPEISSLMHPLYYKTLINHPFVRVYPGVRGMNHPLYFIDHMEPEEPYGDSKINRHEAKFLIQLAVYLLKNNHGPENITILSTYRGQVYALKKQQSTCPLEEVKRIRIAVVDDFQGEENMIILLSLVSNNAEEKIGFFSTENRVCVALSRAKQGFYIMGNMTQLCAASDVWKSIRTTLHAQNAISKFLPLRCKNHQGHETLVSKDTDFLPEGGCDKPCRALLNCGHHCAKICHPYDVDHNLYHCMEKCIRSLCANVTHKCQKLCFEKCGRCEYFVPRQLSCGHFKKLQCHVKLKNFKCLESEKIQPKCGHVQSIPCYQRNEDFRCEIKVEKTIASCGHVKIMPCHLNMIDFKCTFETVFTLKCGHNNKKICGEVKEGPLSPGENKLIDRCEIMIEKIIPGCGHVQILPCHQTIEDFKCKYVLETRWNCGHKRKMFCSDIKTMIMKCEQPCERLLKGCNNLKNGRKCNDPCWQSCLMESFQAMSSRKCRRRCGKTRRVP